MVAVFAVVYEGAAVLELYLGDVRSGKPVWLSAKFLSRQDMFSEFISLPLTPVD
jgi:hypothetical protein